MTLWTLLQESLVAKLLVSVVSMVVLALLAFRSREPREETEATKTILEEGPATDDTMLPSQEHTPDALAENNTNDDSQQQEADGPFLVGHRIVLRNLKKASHLNGRHGVIGSAMDESSGRFKVDLDLLDPASPRVAVKACNMERENPIPVAFTEQRAGASDGILEEQYGRAISFIFEAMRYLVGHVFHCDPEIKDVTDIDRFRNMGPMGLLKISQLMGAGWSLWTDPGPYHGTDGKGLYQLLKKYLQQDIVEANGGLSNMDPEYNCIFDAIDHVVAVKGWHVRVHGDFWVVGEAEDGSGAFLVPDSNRHAVYKVLGVRNALYPPVARDFIRPVKMKITMVPWYGRLVYDGVVGIRTPEMASISLTEKLRRAVQRAKDEGRVVDRLAQLEVPGGSLDGLTSQNPSKVDATAEEKVEEPTPTAEERGLVESLARIPPYPMQDGNEPNRVSHWVFRRMGYTEEENPSHEGLILSAAGMPVGFFSCSALEPSSVDILTSLVENAERGGQRPSWLGIDAKACCDRVKFLLKDMEGIKVFYYLPPSAEEQAALRNGPPPTAMLNALAGSRRA